MFTVKLAAKAVQYLQSAALCALALTATSADVFAAPAGAVVLLAPAGSVKKVANGKLAAQVDNGWVIYQGLQGQPILNFYDGGATGSFKLKTAGFGSGGAGLLFDAGGIVFAPCPATGAPVRCDANSTSGTPGVGIGFGQATFGGAGGQAGGWVNDSSLAAHVTNPDQVPGSIAALAVDATNGAFAVGWDADNASFSNHAIIWALDSAGQTYKPTTQTDLGTLGGRTSSALGISKNAQYVVGMADDASNKSHAVYALSTGTAWTDIASTVPTGTKGIIKSRALAASNTGFIAGTATVKRLINGKKHSVDIGFVYNTNTNTTTFFEAPGYDVIPLKVLDDGRVVGNLELIATGNAVKADHPFIASGTTVTDFGVMGGAYGCRVNRPNTLGEVAGSCIASPATPYGVGGTAFYIDAANGGSYVDVNAAMHANSDANTIGLSTYKIGSVTSIDNAHEITVMAMRTVGGNISVAGFLASKPAYNP